MMLQNRVVPHYQVSPLISMRTEALASSQICLSVDADAWCKRVLNWIRRTHLEAMSLSLSRQYKRTLLCCILFDIAIQTFWLLCFTGERSLSPVSILVTPTHIFLINENYNWPLPRSTGSTGAPVKQQQFELRDLQRINDITSIVSIQ